MHARRVGETAAVLRSGVCAGTMESSKGRAMVTPMPRRTLRLERCFFVRNIRLLKFYLLANREKSGLPSLSLVGRRHALPKKSTCDFFRSLRKQAIPSAPRG